MKVTRGNPPAGGLSSGCPSQQPGMVGGALPLPPALRHTRLSSPCLNQIPAPKPCPTSSPSLRPALLQASGAAFPLQFKFKWSLGCFLVV